MHHNSLRRQLLRRLLWPFTLILLTGALLAYFFASQAAKNTGDLGLLDDALDLAKQVEVHEGKISLDLPLAAKQMLLANNDDRVAYAAWDQSGHLIAGDAELLPLATAPAEKNHWFSNVAFGGHDGRIVVFRDLIQGYQVNIAVFQTSLGSEQLLRDTFISMLLPEAMLVIVAVLVIVFGVRSGLRPVELLRDEIATRSASDLKSIPESPAPEELRPIIHGINDLLENLAAAFAVHRRFIADAAHQLRTPLAALSGQIELALKQPPADNQAFLNKLLATTLRTSHLSNQLLSLARLEHSMASVCERHAIDLRQVISEAVAVFVTQAELKNIVLEFNMESSIVDGNTLLLGELLANLLDNALRYTPSGGQVLVTLQPDDEGCVLQVQDSGPGVPQNELGKLGMPFHRFDSSIPGSCGLGLAIVREIVRIHDAEITFSAPSPSTGLIVAIKFSNQKQKNFD